MSLPQKNTDTAAEGKSSAGIETLSIPEYRERLKAKLDDAVDFDDDVEMEEGEASSSKRKESIDSDSLDPHAGSRRPREGDDSDASSSKRSRGESDTPLSAAGALSSPRDVVTSSSPRAAQAARDPWMPSASEIADRVGNTVPPNEIPLYVCSGIRDDAVAEAQHFDPLTNQRRDYYIGLFHELWYFSSKKTSSRSKVPEWQALCQSWNAFVENFNKKPAAYRERVKHARKRFETFSTRGRLEQLHRSSVDAGIPCAVPEGNQCTLCLPGAVRLSDRDLNGYTTIRIPESLKDLRAKFLAREERDDRGASGAVGDHSARTTFASAVRGELRTPSPFPECPATGRPAAPMYLGGAETLSNEYDNEPADGSFSGYYGSQYAQQSSVLSRGRRGSEAAVVGTRPGYGQPGVDLGPTLEERVAAVEQLQSRECAALKQEMATLRAQVAQASQTASDISVDVGGRVARLAQRVHALEQRFASAGASASGQPS
ncbi:hypothetical protein PHYSODRAFT_332132 [Phytophthora sojae]|uniref:Uncharacterized protein n=1 Tax=Phytophthora sojae (strain P6497) TaxID=1094619 RepID=G4ZCV0_PHYSP|nr:hypothetical protein PHYSODRAFT_332128 [Phytophthora sojae]XP_009527366.1 hypothetical protein PHYSODRAFT_332132 [Phytophthora sojae]EGZ18307.1 hypothetical protein PHYSODRAFT_332128 [Phytophthora sojae]EGZ18308.1 hypothetical protein PHYSODRAFT_332132 [Phytophthora sojae]|eukprot:XP_009527365.1 hypothetical protein PHYSODRAFT_332128 [Phytophthora sojae]